MYRNTKNVPYYVFGRGSLAQLGDLLKPRREAVDGPVVYFVDHFFRDHELIGRLPMEKGDQLHFVDSSSEPEVTRIDAFKEAVSAADSRIPCCVVGIGEPKKTFPEIGESYRESRRAVEVGRIFLTEQHIYVYRSLVLERFLMDIPREMGTRYHGILFNRKTARLFNDEMLHTIEMFFAKDLNLSDTARQLYIHRNTLVYRLDKVQRQTGLDLRKFDDAVTFKMMMLLGKSGKDKPRPVY